MAKSLLWPLPANFDPVPTAFKGGIPRMVELFNELRGKNPGGYGGSVVQQIGVGKGKWGAHVHQRNWTSCSPFTATIIAMLFDKDARTSGDFEPMYNDGKEPLPSCFYSLHNGFFLSSKDRPEQYRAWASKGWAKANNSASSIRFFGLGYKIEAKHLRRGDFVGINWSNRGGHAVFVWDVHTNDKGETDAFCFVSSNGSKLNDTPKYSGYGISIGGCGGPTYFDGGRATKDKPGSLKGKFNPFFADRDIHIADAHWYVVPGKTVKDIDMKTWKDKVPLHIIDRNTPKAVHIASLDATRFYGMKPPPDLTGGRDVDYAMSLGTFEPPQPYAMGKAAPIEVNIPKVEPLKHKGEPEKAKESPPKPAKQDVKAPAPVQDFVEVALKKLFDAGWIDKGPGDMTKTNDAETKAAIEDFQTKWKLEPVDKIAGKKTRAALREALNDLAENKSPPHKEPPKPKPKIERVTWLANRVEPGEDMYFMIHGEDITALTHMKIALKGGGKSANVEVDLALEKCINAKPIRWPKEFSKGAVVTASFSASGNDGSTVKYESKTPVYVGKIVPIQKSDWPWDPSEWTQKMRNIHDELVNTKPPTGGNFEKFEVTQYYVKEMQPGDVEVKDAKGEVFGTCSLKSLMQADIEGTMRLDGRVLNIVTKGNVYEDKEVEVDGKKVIKKKPNAAKFDPEKSRWTDVTARAPWGSGSRTPLIPYRTLAINPGHNKHLYHKKVYIKQLDGMKLPWGEVHNGVCIVGDCGGMRKEHFDLFAGRKGNTLSIHSVGGKGGTLVEAQILGECEASQKKR